MVTVKGEGLARQGFGAQVRAAMHDRGDFLAELGLDERDGQRVILARNILSTLRERELTSACKTITDQTGLIFRPMKDGDRASGIYCQSVQVASGRFPC